MKKIIALLLALMLLCSATALAAGSKNATNTTTVTTAPVVIETVEEESELEIELTENAAEAELTAADIEITVVTNSDEQNAVLKEIVEVVEAGKPVVTYFPAAVQAKIAEVVAAANVKAEELELTEFIAVDVKAAIAAIEKTSKVTLACATKYTAATKVVVLVGVYNEKGEIEWKVVDGVVNADGDVEIELENADLVAMANAEDATFAILAK